MRTKFSLEHANFSTIKLIMSLIFLTAGPLIVGCQVATAAPTRTPVPTSAPTPLVENSADTTIRLTSGEWVPYTGANFPNYGCDSWVVTEAFALEGITVEYGFFPWARSYYLSETGQWDGAIEWADTEAHRETHYVSAEPLSKQEWVFFYRQDHPLEWATMNDLAGKTIGITIGYAYSDVFEELMSNGNATFDEAPSDDLGFKKLIGGRIDVFPIERRVGYVIMSENLTPEEQALVTEHPKPISEFLPYLLLSKAVPENEQRIALFNNGFKRLQESGRYAEIMQTCAP